MIQKENDSVTENASLEEICQKYRDCIKENYTFVLRADGSFENSIFFGASKSGVAVMTEPQTERCNFSKCIFFFKGNLECGSAISMK